MVRHDKLVSVQHKMLVFLRAWDPLLIMPTPNEKLAESLAALHDLQKGGRRVFKSDDLTRTNRERLVQNGFLQEVMKGWLISSRPSARAGDSTPWYASFWEFSGGYF